MSPKYATYIIASLSLLTFVETARAQEKCYQDTLVEASFDCDGNDSRSADFTTGCKAVPAHIEKKEIACPVGKWVNVSAETRVSSSGKAITPAQVCASVGMLPFNVNGKICASGERPARAGNGWQSIVYKYGLKGGGNGNDGGDRLETVKLSNQNTNSDKQAMLFAKRKSEGTMCYDYSMGEKNHTQEDAVVAVYCK
jgi:hypothetical protein|nr:hypothetical protein [Neorhizobium tomejilense]